MRSLGLETLAVRAFRNLEAVDLWPSPRFNVVSGDNGQGKTNLLEAIYVLATSKSFRTPKPGDLVRYGEYLASVRGRILEEDQRREQSVGLKPGVRVAKLDGKKPGSLAAYAIRTPVVLFHPGEISLSMGNGAERRRLLDRLALFLLDGPHEAAERYLRAMRERQRALETRGASAADLDHWEELMVLHGLAIMAVRADVSQRLASAAILAFERIASPAFSLSVRYAPSAPCIADAYRRGLVSSRATDFRRGGARLGPHRDDLALQLDGRAMRGSASQGQHRAAVLALKAAEIELIGSARGARPILLLDDVSSELDRARTAALFSFLREQRGQVFLTTTRPELIGIAKADRSDFLVEAGKISPG